MLAAALKSTTSAFRYAINATVRAESGPFHPLDLNARKETVKFGRGGSLLNALLDSRSSSEYARPYSPRESVALPACVSREAEINNTRDKTQE